MKERNYGIDLLRLVLMFMVCMLHILGQGGVLTACIDGSLEYKTFYFLEIFAYCAVDGFALISGYTAVNRPQKYLKIVDMWFQAFFYSFVVTLLLTVVGINTDLGIKDLIKSAFPVTFGSFWYFTAYFALFFAAPLLNKFIFSIDVVSAKKALLIIGILFSVLGVLADPFKSVSGYSAIWLMVLYCIGALARKIELFEKKPSYVLVALWAACIAFTWAAKVFLDIGVLINYISPTILLSGIIMVVLFSRIRPNAKFVSKLSPLAFGIYLFHTNMSIWNNILYQAFMDVAAMNIFVGVLCVFGGSLGLFASGLIVEFIRMKLAKLFKLSTLSEKIVQLADKLLLMLFPLIK